MNPSTLYLYTLSAFVVIGKAVASTTESSKKFGYKKFDSPTYTLYSDVESESDHDALETDSERFSSVLNRSPDDPGHTDDEMYKFNQSLDKTVRKVNRIYKKELAKVQGQLDAIKDEEGRAKFTERLYRKVSHSVFRDYGNFSTLKDGTFFGDMFAAPAGYEQPEDL